MRGSLVFLLGLLGYAAPVHALTVNPNATTVLQNGIPAGLDDMVFDSSGNIYIVTTTNVLKYTFPFNSASSPTVVAQAGLTEPYALFIDSGGNYYVADGSASKVFKYPANSNSTTTPSLTLTNGVSQPSDILLDSSGNLFLVNGNSNSNVVKFAASAFTASTNSTVVAQTGLQNPSGFFRHIRQPVRHRFQFQR